MSLGIDNCRQLIKHTPDTVEHEQPVETVGRFGVRCALWMFGDEVRGSGVLLACNGLRRYRKGDGELMGGVS